RDPSREVVEHEVDDPRLDHAAAVSRAPRARPLAGRDREALRQARGPGVSSAEDTTSDLNARIDTIEEAYEFFLAYASQGLPSDAGSDTGRQARHHLQRCDQALHGLAGAFTQRVEDLGLQPKAPYDAFIAVIDRDAK